MVCLLVIIRKEVIRVKAIRIFGRSIRDAFKSITRNFSLSMASILCDMITLIIVSVAIIIAVNVNNATRSIEKEMNIVVYINKNASEEDSNNAYLEIKNIKGKKIPRYPVEMLYRKIANKSITLADIMNHSTSDEVLIRTIHFLEMEYVLNDKISDKIYLFDKSKFNGRTNQDSPPDERGGRGHPVPFRAENLLFRPRRPALRRRRSHHHRHRPG